MRWIWIDKFVDFQPKKYAAAVKCATLAEEHLHDLYPDFPIVPHSLIVEGMAQTAGILVGEARDFKEKVVLAKVGKAVFHQLVRPGDTIIFKATVEQLNEVGASISGRVEMYTPVPTTCPDQTQVAPPVAEIELMFSHVDQNFSGIKFPEHNFVFEDEMFMNLLKDYYRRTTYGI
ncbi:MAG: hypothetical protein QM754_11725 [Tepidisphaeraceae bacterium]